MRWNGSALLVLLACVLPSCAIIPRVDTTPPQIELRVSGANVGSKTMSNPPTEYWTDADGAQFLNLLANGTYRFTLIVTDQGGVERAALGLPATFVLSDLEGEGLEITTSDGGQRWLTVRGNRSEPRRILTIAGQLRPIRDSGSGFDFNGEADDFGGASGASNQRFIGVSGYVE